MKTLAGLIEKKTAERNAMRSDLNLNSTRE
jgi:hypothetical protein